MKTKGLFYLIIFILLFGNITASNFELYSSGRFPMANFKGIKASEYNSNLVFAVATKNGIGILNENSGDYSLKNFGVEGEIISPQLVDPSGDTPYLYYIINPDGYSNLSRVDTNTGIIKTFSENNIIGQISYSSLEGESRTYAINLSGDIIKVGGPTFTEESRVSSVLTMNPGYKKAKILKNPWEREIFYVYQPPEQNFYAIDARTSKGYENSPHFNTMLWSYPIIDANIVKFRDASYDTKTLAIADDSGNINIYTFSSGNTNINSITSFDYSSQSGGFNGNCIATDDIVPYKMWVCIPDNNQILQINFGLTGITYNSITVNNLKFIYASRGDLYVFRENRPMEIYSLPLSGGDSPVDYNNNVDIIKVKKTQNGYIAINNLGTGIFTPNINLAFYSDYHDVFSSYSGSFNWLDPANNNVTTFATESTSDNFATKMDRGIAISTAGASYGPSNVMPSADIPSKRDLALAFGNKVYSPSIVAKGLVLYNFTGPDTTIYSFSTPSSTIEGMKYDKIHHYIIGFYNDASSNIRLYIFSVDSNLYISDQDSPGFNIDTSNFAIDPQRSRIYVKNASDNADIQMIGYSNPSNPIFLGNFKNLNNNGIIRMGIIGQKIITTDYDGMNYHINFFTIDDYENVTNTETYNWTTNANNVSAEFSVYGNMILASLGNGYYDIYQYKSVGSGINPDNYDYYPFPNPTDGIVNVAFLPEQTTVRLYNSNGTKIDEMKNVSGTFTLDLTTLGFKLHTGKYFIYIKIPDKKAIVKPLFYYNKEEMNSSGKTQLPGGKK